MLRIVLHGDNTVASRKVLTDYREQAKADHTEILSLDGMSLDPTGLTEALESGSLFAAKRLVVIEHLHRNRSKTRLAQLVKILSEASDVAETDVVLWEQKLLTKTMLKKLVGFEAKEFKASSNLFPFLGAIAPANARLVTQLRDLLSTDAPELVFFMIARQVSEMIQARDGVLKGPAWKTGKLAAQAERFGPGKLEQLHASLTELDWSVKSGSGGIPLTLGLELVLLEL